MNDAIGKTSYGYLTYALESVIIFGILGNILVIISIARQKQLLKKNYYFTVLHVAVCDLAALITQLLFFIVRHLGIENYRGCSIPCVIISFYQPFHYSGIAIMLMVSVLHYRATVHPLQSAISRAKLIKICYVVYVVGLTTGLGLTVPQCFISMLFDVNISVKYLIDGFNLFVTFIPVIFTIVCYCKISRALIKQNRQMKRMGLAAVGNRHSRDRRIFHVCLCTVVCFAVGRLLWTVILVWAIADEYSYLHNETWVLIFVGNFLLIAGTHSANPLIYGILDITMFAFLKQSRKKGQTPQELPMQEL